MSSCNATLFKSILERCSFSFNNAFHTPEYWFLVEKLDCTKHVFSAQRQVCARCTIVTKAINDEGTSPPKKQQRWTARKTRMFSRRSAPPMQAMCPARRIICPEPFIEASQASKNLRYALCIAAMVHCFLLVPLGVQVIRGN